MQNPINNQVTKTWEAYGDKNVVFYQHLEPFDKAQEYLGRMIALQALRAPLALQHEATAEFFTFFLKTVFKARIKMEKYNLLGNDIDFTKQLDEIIDTIILVIEGKNKKIDLKEYVIILFKIGILYDKLGYNSPERLKIRTPMQSDIFIPGTELPEEMTNIPVITGISGDDD